MLKKFGMISVGVTAGLLAVAPMASATESHHGSDQDGVGNIQCGAESGDNETSNESDAPITGLQAGSTGSNNAGQILSCNSFLNHVASDNDINLFAGED